MLQERLVGSLWLRLVGVHKDSVGESVTGLVLAFAFFVEHRCIFGRKLLDIRTFIHQLRLAGITHGFPFFPALLDPLPGILNNNIRVCLLPRLQILSPALLLLLLAPFHELLVVILILGAGLLDDLLVKIARRVALALFMLLLQRGLASSCLVCVMEGGTGVGQGFLGLRVLHLINIFIQISNEKQAHSLAQPQHCF